MLAMRAAACLAALVLLAGCSDPAPTGDADGASATPTGGAGGSTNRTVPAPQPMTLPVELDGNLGSFVHYCAFPASRCDTHIVTPDHTDIVVEHVGANFTGLDVNLTWMSSSPATDELALGFMVMSTCEGCEDPFEDEVRGTSPLRATLTGMAVPLNETTVVHLYVYNPKSFQSVPGGAGYTFASVDMDFRLEGTVHVLMSG